MSLPPAALLPLLVELDERFVGALLTARVYTFAPTVPGAKARTGAVWACATRDRFWLVARDEQTEQEWRFAVGDARAVAVEHGWQRDVLHVGPHRAILRRNTRAEAVELVAKWRRGGPSGDPWPLAIPWPRPAPAAPGALPLPDLGGIDARDTDERWLCGVETDLSWPHCGAEGTVDVAIWVVASTRRTALVAPHPEGGPGWSRDVAPGFLGGEGRWRLGELAVTARGPRATIDLLETLAPLTEPADRLAVMARQAILTGNPRRALHLIGEATRTGQAGPSHVYLGQLALALGQPDLAAAAGWRALVEAPALDPMAIADLQQRELPTVERAIRAARLDLAEARSLAPAAWEALADAPPHPEGLPWPPQGVWEAWAAALVARHRFDEARAALARTPASTRRAVAEAAIATLAGAVDAAARWRIAAQKAREEGGNAWKPLAIATGLDETAADRWRWAAWAWQDGQWSEAKAAFRRAMALDASGAFVHPLPPAALEAVAEVAERTGRPKLAIDALRRAVAAAPRAEGPRVRLATLLVTHDPAGAADVWVSIAEALDQGSLDQATTSRGTAWIAASRLRAAAGRPEEALRALDEALAGDFLDPRIWDLALAQTHVEIPARTLAFRAHLRRLLVGAAAPEDGAPLPPLDALDDVALDALHPGGVGWLESLRRWAPAPEPPPVTTLLRGLETLDDGGFPEALAALEAPRRALGLRLRPIGAVFRGPGAHGVAAWPGKPPVVLIGVEHLRTGPRNLEGAELAFALAAEVVHLRCDHPLLVFDQNWLGSSRSAWEQLSGWAGAAEMVFDVVTLLPGLDQVKKVQTVIRVAQTAFRARGLVDRGVKLTGPASGWFSAAPAPLTREKLSGFALQMRLQAERAALLLVGDARAAARAMIKLSTSSPSLADRLDRDGLVALLREGALPPDLALRVSDLVRFAVGLS